MNSTSKFEMSASEKAKVSAYEKEKEAWTDKATAAGTLTLRGNPNLDRKYWGERPLRNLTMKEMRSDLSQMEQFTLSARRSDEEDSESDSESDEEVVEVTIWLADDPNHERGRWATFKSIQAALDKIELLQKETKLSSCLIEKNGRKFS